MVLAFSDNRYNAESNNELIFSDYELFMNCFKQETDDSMAIVMNTVRPFKASDAISFYLKNDKSASALRMIYLRFITAFLKLCIQHKFTYKYEHFFSIHDRTFCGFCFFFFFFI